MATYQVKATYSVDVEIEIDAISEEEAISKLIGTDFRDIVKDGIVTRSDLEDETAEISEANYKVKVSDIHYDISESDVEEIVEEEYGLEYNDVGYDDAIEKAIQDIRKDLPNEMVVEVKYCAPEDVEDYAIDEVSDKTGWLVSYANIKVLEVK